MDFSLLETMRLDAGAIVRLERHLARLAASARHFEYAYDETRTRAAIAATEAAHREGSWRVRLLVSRDGTPTIEIAPYTPENRRWRVAFAGTPVDHRDDFLLNKTTNRAVYDSAKKARPDVDDVILWNGRGEVTESTIANVVVEINGTRCTPPVSSGLLGGTFRGELIANGTLHERVLRRVDVATASGLWLINSVREWMDAVLV